MPPRLRIGYFLAPYPEGGLARHVLALIDRMRERYSVVVFCDRRQETFQDALKQRELTPHVIANRPTAKKGILRPILESCGPMIEARRAFRAERLDIVHFHAGRLGAIYPAIVASRWTGIPTRLLTVHNQVLRRSPLQRLFEARVLGSLDAIVAVGAEVKGELMEKKNVTADKISVIVNGIELTEFDTLEPTEKIRAELGVDSTASVLGVVGRLHYDKGIDLLIRALALLKPRYSQLRAVIIGSGPDEAALKGLAETEGVGDIIHFAGYRADARRLMPALDMIAMPSRRDAQPFALLEAMAARRAVVAAAVGGIPGILIDGVTGVLFPSENVNALAAALEKLLKDPGQRKALGEAARQRVKKEFSESAMIEKTAALYEEAAARKTD
jgi:glycosyltransferase involved in cell wall biosynthesis